MNTAATSQTNDILPQGVSITAPVSPAFAEILTPEALAFVAKLVRAHASTRDALLNDRIERQRRLDNGELLDFLPETQAIREGDWKVAPIPQDLQDRRVEITGPTDRKMVINALNSDAKVFMADFEDSLSPTWENVIDGQINMRDALARNMTLDTGAKTYQLNDNPAVLIVRPRGWHLVEKHILIDGHPAPASLVDFGLCFFHNAKVALANGTGPYFYLPKLESHHEAALWAAVFRDAEDELGLERGTIKATVLIETISAVFEMHEILHALKDYCVGLNCGRWDYIFSFIKKFRSRPDFVLPERSQVGMTVHFLRSYSQLLIQTCHKRGAFAMGGMAAQIPVKHDEAANEKAFNAVRADKKREATDGHDGTWVAQPGLIPVAMEQFDAVLGSKPNQLDIARDDVNVSASDLLAIPTGSISEAGLRNNINVSIYYLAAWLAGNGCVPIYNLMEDAATAEISRSQLWQWVRYDSGKLDDGRNIDMALFKQCLEEELASIRQTVGEEAFAAGTYAEAARIFADLVERDDFVEFLTLPAYDKLP